MSVTTKLEVEYSQFKKGMAEAQASVKTLDAELKLSEAQFKATGDAEKYAAEQAALLQQKLNAQKEAAKNAEQMFLNLAKRGVAPTSQEYQRMAQKMLNAQAAVATTQAELNKLNTKQETAAGSAKTLADEVGNIGKNVSLQNITDGLSKITDGMEKAYRTAVRLGKTVMRSMMDATGWADDVQTRAIQYGTDAETIQKMDRVAAYIDTDVDTIISAKDRMSRNRENLAELLGISSDGRNVDDVFWEAGEAIMNLGEDMDKSDYAMKIFGKGWRELLPLFTAGREEYESLMESQDVLSNEQVEALAKADDEIQKVQSEIANLKREFWAEHSGTVIELLEWVVSNKDAVVAALTAIAGAFAALKTAETAANIMKIVNGLKGLTGGSAANAATNAAINAAGSAGTTTQTVTTQLINGAGGMAEGLANFMTSKAGVTAIGTLMLTPIITKLANGDYFKDPWEGVDQKAKDFLTQSVPIGKGTNVRNALTSIFGGGEKAEVPVDLKPDTTAEDIAAEVGTVTVPATLDWRPSYRQGYGQQTPGWGGHANGLPWVPTDGYLAVLHRGERVLTASQNRNYTANSNLYVERMIMNNGQDAEGLAAAMAAQNRRVSAGFGA